MSIDVAMKDLEATGNAINVDTTQDYEQRDQWPSFDNWEYTVIFKDALSGNELKRCKDFLSLVEKTGLIAQVFKSPANDQRILLKLKASQAWYDEKATKLNYLYELKPIVCEIPDDEDIAEIVRQKLAREKKQAPLVTRMFEPFDADEKELYMFNGYADVTNKGVCDSSSKTLRKGIGIEHELRKGARAVRFEIRHTDKKIRVKQRECDGVGQHRPHSEVFVDVNWLSKNIT